MRILIDLQSCQSGSRLGGIGRYSMALAKAMIRQGGGHEFFLLLNKQLPAEHEVRDQFRSLLPQHRILAFDVPGGVAEARCDPSRTRLAELIRERFIADVQPDVVHVSSLIEGLGDDVVTSVGEFFLASRTAVTLYDLIPLVERELYLTNHVLEHHYLNKIEHMRKAGMLLAISDYSRREGVEFGGFPSGRIVNISSAVDEVFKPHTVSAERRHALFAHYGIREQFLMYTGSFDSRKNQPRLIEAFGRLPRTVRAGYQLVIVGNGWDGVYNDLRALARSCGLGDDDVLFPGRVGDEDLLDLYNLCALFVFPSLREGFGLPVLEAMSCGVPTIGANTTSVPEVLGRADAMFDPADVSSIAAKIQQALTDRAFREALKTHALSHAKNFSWDISARKALDFIEARMAYSDSTEGGSEALGLASSAEVYAAFLERISQIPGVVKLTDDFLLASAAALAANEVVAAQILSDQPPSLKIGWVTTWNTRCGIASYTRHLVENTGGIFKIFAPDAQAPTEPDGKEVERCWNAGYDDLRTLNDAIDHSGVDVVAIQMNYGFFDFPSLSDLIAKQTRAGRVVTITLHSTVDPPPHILNRRLIDLTPALNACDAVLVHSLADVVNLEKIGVVENVALFPQGVVRPSGAIPSGNWKNGTFTIGTYGFFLPHKGLEQVIEAVALLRSQGVDVVLEMVNAEYSPAASGDLIRKCQALIEARGLTPYVRMTTAYLNEQESLRRLAATDLVVFAYQGTGESSSAAVRMGLAAGALVAVTPLAIFNDVHDHVLRLPGTAPADLAQGIRVAMAMMADDAPVLNVLRENSKRWVDNHQFRHLARYFCNLIEQFANRGAPPRGGSADY